MNRLIRFWQTLGFFTASALGTLFHFLYDILNGSLWIAPFSGVNESTWEHMKLLFWPMLIFGLIQRFFLSDIENYWHVKLRGMLLGLSLIPLFYFTYNGIIGVSPHFVNISIFYISAAASYYYEARLFLSCKKHYVSLCPSLLIILLIGAGFVIFTFYPPRIEIFRDPLTSIYGICR